MNGRGCIITTHAHDCEECADSKMISISVAFCLSVTSLVVLFACTSGQPTELVCRPRCCKWMNQDYGLSSSSPTPRGFVQTVLPNPEDMLSDPCITVTAQETNQYIEILAETATLGGNSRVCVTVNDDPLNSACGNGQVSYCDQVSSLNMTITIFCDASCDLAATTLWFRVNISQAVSFDDESWCDRRLGDYPSGLISVVTPPGVTDPTGPNNSTDSTNTPQPTSSPEPTNAGTTPSSNLLLMLCIIALTRVYNNF